MDLTDLAEYSKEELIELIENMHGLYWSDYPEDLAKKCKKEFPYLKEVKSRNITTIDILERKPLFDFIEQNDDKMKYHTPHILIEGDNYHSLSVLNFTHKGRINIIYIDPPYNTGNEGWRYNDRKVEKDDGYRHSKWLSFMEKRLVLAKDLLTEDGVIFISIDDNEQAELKLLCNKIFGAKNFLTTAIWQKKVRPSNKNEKGFSSTTEYILCYAKNIDTIDGFVGDEHDEEYLKVYKNSDNDPRGPWRTKPLWSESNTNKRKTLITPDGRSIERKWFISQKTLDWLYKNNLIYETKNTITQKLFLSGITSKNPINFLSAKKVGTTEQATKELKDIPGIKKFEYPKPVKLMKYLINKINNRNSIVLDFFAGSGTIGHAVLELNKEDQGNRQFILCTNNEDDICTDTCHPRLKKVIEGYTKSNGDYVEGIPANLKYYKCDDSCFVTVSGSLDQLKFDFAQKGMEMLCLKEGVYDLMVEEKENAEALYKIFKHGDKYLGIFYDDMFNEEGIKRFSKTLVDCIGHKVVYLFTLAEEFHEEDIYDYGSLSELEDIEIKPLPVGIVNTYRRLFRR